MTCYIHSKAIPSRKESSGESPEPVPSLQPQDSRPRPRLLVSARSAAEVEMVIESGADIVDLKEPRAGALAPTSRELWSQIADRWDGMKDRTALAPLSRAPLLSAALGEPSEAVSCARDLPPSFDFAKVGPSGCDRPERLRQTWADVRNQLDARIELVGVAYADWQQAGCVAPEVVFELASEFGLRRCLLDTFRKDGSSSIDLLGTSSLGGLADRAKRLGLWWTLAGSVRRQDLARLRSLDVIPDCLGVRGDVCEGSREGTLKLERIQSWLQELRQNQP